MLKVPEAVKSLIDNNPLLQFGLKERLLNLSQTARYLLPDIAVRTKKDVQESAIVMSLSRLQSEYRSRLKASVPRFSLGNIVVNSNLCSLTFLKTKQTHRSLTTLYAKVLKEGGYITINEGIREITVLISMDHLADVKVMVSEQAMNVRKNIAAIGLTFDQDYQDNPGLFYLIFQHLYFQNLNVIEIASTTNELVLYLHEDEVRLAFDTIYNHFIRK